MTIDFKKCYEEMDLAEPRSLSMVGPFVRQQINLYVKEYNRQLQEQLAERHMSHLCNAHGLTTCDCEGRKKIQDDYYIWQEDGGLWVRRVGNNDTQYIENCPLCGEPLP